MINGRSLYVLLFVPVLCALYCTSSLYNFNTVHNFTRSGFTGRNLDNRIIGICPLLTAAGPVLGEKIAYSEIIERIKEERTDLKWIDADSVHVMFTRKMTGDERETFYALLYNARIVALQTADTLWRKVTPDFLIVFRLRHGMDIRTFNQLTRKKVIIEVELWEPASRETVWRTTIHGSCNNRGVSEREFLEAALQRGAVALPGVLPSYNEPSPW